MEKKKFKLRNKRENGITLVALVITIIVLIILAGVSINAVMNDGLIGNAKDAKDEYDVAKEKEKAILKSMSLQVYFSSKGINRNASNGYITNIEPKKGNGDLGTTVKELKADLPEGYKVYEINGEDEITGEAEETTQVTTGMVVKDSNDEFIAKTIIFGDVNGDGGVGGSDASLIQAAMIGGSKNAGAGEDCFMVAGDGWIKPEDVDYIVKSTLNGNPKVDQNQIAKYPTDITLETEAMRNKVKVDKFIEESTFPSSYSKTWNEDGGYYDITVENNKLDVETLIGYFEGQEVQIYKMNVETEDSEEVTSGSMVNEYDYLLAKGEVACLYFTVK